MAAKRLDLVIRQGETFQRIIRWETLPFIYKAITAITAAAPASITATAHGLTNGWRVAVVSVRGMTQINAENSPPRTSDFEQVTVGDANTVTLNRINSADFNAYTSGGYLQFYTPVDLTGYEARMKIKDRVGGTELASFTSDPPDNRITVDNAAKTITVELSAVDAAALAFTKGVYDLEMVSPGGVVTTIFSGSISVVKEVTA